MATLSAPPESGRAVAFMMDDALLAGERAKAKKPDNWEIVGTPQSKEAYGCMLRKDDPTFKALVDETVAQCSDLWRSGRSGLTNGSKTRFRQKS